MYKRQALIVLDATDLEAGHQATCEAVADVPLRLWIYNKADLLPSVPEDTGGIVHVSARSRLGLETLRVRLRELAVSYPHLDVYKRQTQTRCCACTGWPAKPLRALA